MKSPKEEALNRKLLSSLKGKTRAVAEILINDKEIRSLQEYANIVSIKRLGFNDHGPVHMRKVAQDAMRIVDLLSAKGIKFNLEQEEIGTLEDSRVAIFLSAFLHDIGMSVGRQHHEQISIHLLVPVINRVLERVYNDDVNKRVILRSLAIEGIIGHMAVHKIHSLEAGVILVADGCDMERGRARIPMLLKAESRVGDIHKYSASEIKRVSITEGREKPVRIMIEMTASVGFFQVEEVLIPKIMSSPIREHIELHAGVIGRDTKRYL